MNTAKRYIYGAIFGMCGEYLYRVGFSVYPLITIIIIAILAFLDIVFENSDRF